MESSGGKLYRKSHVCVSVVPYTHHRQIPALSRLSYFGRLPVSGNGNYISSKFWNGKKNKFWNFGFSWMLLFVNTKYDVNTLGPDDVNESTDERMNYYSLRFF